MESGRLDEDARKTEDCTDIKVRKLSEIGICHSLEMVHDV